MSEPLSGILSCLQVAVLRYFVVPSTKESKYEGGLIACLTSIPVRTRGQKATREQPVQDRTAPDPFKTPHFMETSVDGRRNSSCTKNEWMGTGCQNKANKLLQRRVVLCTQQTLLRKQDNPCQERLLPEQILGEDLPPLIVVCGTSLFLFLRRDRQMITRAGSRKASTHG